MYHEDDLLPISALQHLMFCERQCALIHVERVWTDNWLTVEGRQLHERADSGVANRRGGTRLRRSVPLRSLAYGLYGIADVVEFREGLERRAATTVVPVEYKRGRHPVGDADRVQLCAQALCLEEMLGVAIGAGALYYGGSRRRIAVAMDSALRATTFSAVARLREIVDAGVTPAARKEAKCDRCSLIAYCMPGVLAHGRQSGAEFSRALVACLDQ